MRYLSGCLSFWAFLFLPFLYLRMAEPGGGAGATDPGAGAGGAGNDGKTAAGAGNGGQPGAAAVDVQAAIRDALAKQQAEFQQQFKAATGHDSLTAFQEAEARRKGEEGKLLETRSAELAAANQRIADMRIRSALSDAAIAHKAIDPATVVALLSAQGKVENDAVTFGGKSPTDAVAGLLKAKPFLAQAAGAGGGTPAGGGAGAEKNPWSKDHFNLTERIRIGKENPTLAAQMKAAAGKS